MWLLCLGVGLLPLLATPRSTPTRWRCPPPATRSSTPSFTPSETQTSRNRSGWRAAGASLPQSPPGHSRRKLELPGEDSSAWEELPVLTLARISPLHLQTLSFANGF
uniref:Uncharacterized protein n=1 Tax=Cyanistes caeruleus TaxID=156563 RepID=A0A8C0U2Q7_CYACU